MINEAGVVVDDGDDPVGAGFGHYTVQEELPVVLRECRRPPKQVLLVLRVPDLSREEGQERK